MAFDPDAYLAKGKDVSGFDPDAYLGIQPKQIPFQDKLRQAVIDSAKNIGTSSLEGAKQIATMSPPIQRMTANALPVLGGLAGAPFGLGGPGAAGGEFARQAANTVINPQDIPKTGLGRFASTMTAGLTQDPAILKAIPGVGSVAEMAGNLASKAASKVGTGAAKLSEAFTGTKAKDLIHAAKQGYSTYLAPSMEKAQGIFGKAMESAGVSAKPPLNQIIDPQLATARDVALEVGSKLEKGLDIGAGEALRARQAVDRIYTATPLIDRATRGHLADLRMAFDDIMAGKSGALKEASTIYRNAIVKSNVLNPFRVTKQGQISAVAPMVASLLSGGIGTKSKEGGLGAGTAYLAASSPLVAGLTATSGGQAAKAFGAIASNPAARQVLLQVLQRIMASRGSGNPAGGNSQSIPQ